MTTGQPTIDKNSTVHTKRRPKDVFKICTQWTSGGTPKRKDKKLNIQRKRRRSKGRRRRRRRRQRRRWWWAWKKNQQFETLNIIVSKHMAEAYTMQPMAPPIIPHEIYGIQWTMIVHSEWTKATRLSFYIQRRANECEREHQIIEPIPEPISERLRNSDSNNEAAASCWCARQRSSCFYAVCCLIVCFTFLRWIVCFIERCFGFSRRAMHSAGLIANFLNEIAENISFLFLK